MVSEANATGQPRVWRWVDDKTEHIQLAIVGWWKMLPLRIEMNVAGRTGAATAALSQDARHLGSHQRTQQAFSW